MTTARHVPQRTCVACRQVRGKAELLRIVRTPLGEVKADPTGKLAGRGAYLCKNESCLSLAMKQKKLAKSLGITIGNEVAEDIKALIR